MRRGPPPRPRGPRVPSTPLAARMLRRRECLSAARMPIHRSPSSWAKRFPPRAVTPARDQFPCDAFRWRAIAHSPARRPFVLERCRPPQWHAPISANHAELLAWQERRTEPSAFSRNDTALARGTAERSQRGVFVYTLRVATADAARRAAMGPTATRARSGLFVCEHLHQPAFASARAASPQRNQAFGGRHIPTLQPAAAANVHGADGSSFNACSPRTVRTPVAVKSHRTAVGLPPFDGRFDVTGLAGFTVPESGRDRSVLRRASRGHGDRGVPAPRAERSAGAVKVG